MFARNIILLFHTTKNSEFKIEIFKNKIINYFDTEFALFDKITLLLITDLCNLKFKFATFSRNLIQLVPIDNPTYKRSLFYW